MIEKENIVFNSNSISEISKKYLENKYFLTKKSSNVTLNIIIPELENFNFDFYEFYLGIIRTSSNIVISFGPNIIVDNQTLETDGINLFSAQTYDGKTFFLKNLNISFPYYELGIRKYRPSNLNDYFDGFQDFILNSPEDSVVLIPFGDFSGNLILKNSVSIIGGYDLNNFDRWNLTNFTNQKTIFRGKHQTSIMKLLTSSNQIMDIKNIHFLNGISENGGAVFIRNQNALITFHDCNFENNFAHNDGGACYQGKYVKCNFWSNKSNQGGCCYNSELDGCAIGILVNIQQIGNSANYGGGCFNCVINNSMIRFNNAINGGGIWGGLITHSNVVSNIASNNGGGMFNPSFYDKFSLENCELNLATNLGNNIYEEK